MAERKKVQKIKPRSQRDIKQTKKSAPQNKALKKNVSPAKKEVKIPMSSDTLKKPAKAPPKSNAVPNKATKKPANSRSVKSQQATLGRDFKPIKKQSGETGESKLSIILGRRAEKRKKRLISLIVMLAVAVIVFTFVFTSPTGPIERITNAFSVMGGGEFPVSVSGTKPIALKRVDNKAYVLTDSRLSGINNGGKEFLSIQHDFSKPVLSTSKERALVYNRESTDFLVVNNTDVIFKDKLQNAIYCADIGYNGSVAFATKSASYAAEILVFDRVMDQYFTWYLAEGLVTDIAVNQSGNYIAVAVLKVKNGSFSSELYCLDTDTEEPIFVKNIPGESVLSLEALSSDRFVYVTDKNAAFVEWDTGDIAAVDAGALSPAYVDVGVDEILFTFGEKAYSKMLKYNFDGEKLSEVEYNGLADDVSFNDETFYVLNANQIFVIDSKGKLLTTFDLKQKNAFIVGFGDGVLSLDNINLNKYIVPEQ